MYNGKMWLPDPMPPRQTTEPVVAKSLYDAIIRQGADAGEAAGIVAHMVEACIACPN